MISIVVENIFHITKRCKHGKLLSIWGKVSGTCERCLIFEEGTADMTLNVIEGRLH